MPRYTVTGGPSGDAGVEVGDKRFEPGDAVDMAAKDAKWLVDGGYLAPAAKTADAPAEED